MNIKEVASILRERYEEQDSPSQDTIARKSRVNRRDGKSATAISKPYFSQIMSGEGKVTDAKISFDIFWALGILLHYDPASLFCIHRGVKKPSKFDIITETTRDLGGLIKHQRMKLNLRVRQAERLSKNNSFSVSSSTWSCIENNKTEKMKIKGETLFAIAEVLHIDPTLLYVMARGLDRDYLESSRRRKLFTLAIQAPSKTNESKEKKKVTVKKSQNVRHKTVGTVEGLKQEVARWVTGRDPIIAVEKKLQDDYVCAACGFRLVIDDIPVIQCHHTNPLEEGIRKTDLKDLVCLCPTCHAIAHIGRPPYGVAEIRRIRKNIELRKVK
jgi:transcriptional regulator with XRE-family HTH domain